MHQIVLSQMLPRTGTYSQEWGAHCKNQKEICVLDGGFFLLLFREHPDDLGACLSNVRPPIGLLATLIVPN